MRMSTVAAAWATVTAASSLAVLAVVKFRPGGWVEDVVDERFPMGFDTACSGDTVIELLLGRTRLDGQPAASGIGVQRLVRTTYCGRGRAQGAPAGERDVIELVRAHDW